MEKDDQNILYVVQIWYQYDLLIPYNTDVHPIQNQCLNNMEQYDPHFGILYRYGITMIY